MATRVVEGKKPYTGGKAISIDENKVISLNLRDENNLIIYDEGDDEIYVDLQLPDGIEPTDAFPVGVTTGRAVVADGWDKAGTIISAKTTSGDEIKILYADEGTLWIDNGTGTFKQIYFKADVDAIAQAIWDYISANCNTKAFYTGTYDVNLAQAVYDWISQGNYGIIYFNPVQGIKRDVIFPPTTTETGTISSWSYTDVRQTTGGMFYEEDITGTFTVSNGVATSGISFNGTVINNEGRIILSQSTAPSNPLEGTTWYDTTNDELKTYNGTAWQNATGGADIEYVTQAEYNALLPGALTDNKHYFIYTKSGGGWQPGANTVLYLPLNGDVVDYSSYGRTFTVYGATDSVGTPVFDTLASGKQVADFIATSPSASNWFAFTDNVTDIPNSGNLTVSFWVNRGGQSTNYYQGMVDFRNDSSYTWMTGVNPDGDFLFHGISAYITSFTPIVGTWYNMVCIVDNGTYSIYKDGDTSNPLMTGSYTYGYSSSKVSIGAFYDNGSPNKKSEAFNGKIGDVIVENKARTAQEISDYFDQTKGDYGIS